MQQRRVRLGDVLDDYCPRERRITNHAVVAMIEDEVKQTRCTTCDAEHEYKHAKVPAPRRKKPVAAIAAKSADSGESPTLVTADEDLPIQVTADEESPVLDAVDQESPILVAADEAVEHTIEEAPTIEAPKEPEAVDVDEPLAAGVDDEWPVHRPLIRATLPRPEGQAPERKPTDFTIRQSGGRFDGQRNGNKSRGNRHARQAQGQSGQSRFGNSRHGSGSGSGSGQGSRHGGGHGGNQQRHGNRVGHPGQRGGRPGPGGGHGRPGQGRGPKRGR